MTDDTQIGYSRGSAEAGATLRVGRQHRSSKRMLTQEGGSL